MTSTRDGNASNGKVFFDMTQAPGEDAIDGIKVDQHGNLYVCGPGGIWMISAEGKHLGTIMAPKTSAQHRLGRRRRQDALHHRAGHSLSHAIECVRRSDLAPIGR